MAKIYGKQIGHLDPNAAQRYYEQGMCDAEIAAECEVSLSSICLWRKKNNLAPNKKVVKKKPKLSPIAQRVEEARAAGKTYGQYMAAMRGGRRW